MAPLGGQYLVAGKYKEAVTGYLRERFRVKEKGAYGLKRKKVYGL
jgi:hypothetical protein